MPQTEPGDSPQTVTKMQTRSIGVKLLPRKVAYEHHPGHMGVTWKEEGERRFRGFRFDVLDLPEEVRKPEMWRSYLFDHTVRGVVVEDVNLEDATTRFPDKVLCKQWDATVENTATLKARTVPGEFGLYSFQPDKYVGAHNCVTWTISTVNGVLGPVLQEIPTGRIKLAVAVLQQIGARPAE